MSAENKKCLAFYGVIFAGIMAVIAFFHLNHVFTSWLLSGKFKFMPLGAGTVFAALFSAAGGVIAMACLNRLRQLQFDYKRKEQLVITDSAIENTYCPVWETAAHRQRTIIRLSEIEQIILCKGHNCVIVYAPVTVLDYQEPYNKGAALQRMDCSGKYGFRIYYAYYKDFEGFVQRISAMSGRPVEQGTRFPHLTERK